MVDLAGKSARKRTYSRKKPKKPESIEEEDLDLAPTNVDDLLAADDDDEEPLSDDVKESEKDSKMSNIIDPSLPPLEDTELTKKDEAEAIEDAKETVKAAEDKSVGPVRRSKRTKKQTPKVLAQKKKKEQKSKPAASRRKKPSRRTQKKKKGDIRDVEEGVYVRLYWEPTKTWSNGIVTKDWGDGYFTIEFEDDVKEQGPLSYKLRDYEWFIVEEKSAQKKGKTRKRKRNKDSDEYTEENAKKQKVEESSVNEKMEALTQQVGKLQAEKGDLEKRVKSLEKELETHQEERKEITKRLETIEMKDCDATDTVGKLMHILNHYSKD